MIITSLAAHPIKSLRPVSLSSLTLTPQGPLHDRRFLLLRLAEPGIKPEDEILSLGRYSQLCLFAQSLYPATADPENADAVLVEYNSPKTASDREINDAVSRGTKTLLVPLYPSFKELQPRNINMHQSSCVGYDMGDLPYAAFFSDCLGFPVRLVYIGESRRKVLGNVAPSLPISPDSMNHSTNLWRILTLGISGGNEQQHDGEQYEIGFADCAPLLVTTMPSLGDVSNRFLNRQAGKVREMDMSKFRPNIVVGPETDSPGEPSAWEEDFWAELIVQPQVPDRGAVTIILTQNCGRCRSINVDFGTGKFGDVRNGGEEPLKYLMKDRRVDSGLKYSPIFGRYGVLGSKASHKVFVGDRVVVSKKNDERTVFEWPGLSGRG